MVLYPYKSCLEWTVSLIDCFCFKGFDRIETSSSRVGDDLPLVQRPSKNFNYSQIGQSQLRAPANDTTFLKRISAVLVIVCLILLILIVYISWSQSVKNPRCHLFFQYLCLHKEIVSNLNCETKSNSPKVQELALKAISTYKSFHSHLHCWWLLE